MNNNRVILFDEKGSPYIAHRAPSRPAGGHRPTSMSDGASSGHGSARSGSKYIQKIEDNGRTRYFYTQDELKAYYNGIRNKSTSRNPSNARKNMTGAADRMIRNTTGDARTTIQNIGNGLRSLANNIPGYSERQEYRQAQANSENAKKAYADALKNGGNTEEAKANYRQAVTQEYEAKQRYGNTSMGRVENAIQNPTKTVIDTAQNVKQAAQNVANQVQNSKAVETAKKAARVAQQLPDIANSALNKTFDTIEAHDRERLKNVEGADIYDEMRKYEGRTLNPAESQEYTRLTNEYAKTPHAKAMSEAESRRQELWDTMTNPVGTIRNVLDENRRSSASSITEQTLGSIGNASQNATIITDNAYKALRKQLDEGKKLSKSDMQKFAAYLSNKYGN